MLQRLLKCYEVMLISIFYKRYWKVILHKHSEYCFYYWSKTLVPIVLIKGKYSYKVGLFKFLYTLCSNTFLGEAQVLYLGILSTHVSHLWFVIFYLLCRWFHESFLCAISDHFELLLIWIGFFPCIIKRKKKLYST